MAKVPEGCQLYGSKKVVKYKLEEGKTLPFAINAPLKRTKVSSIRGQKVFLDNNAGNCLACHQASLPKSPKSKNNSKSKLLKDQYSFQGGIAGSLDKVGTKYTPGELRMIIVDPKSAFPGKNVIMPAYYKLEGLQDVETSCEGRTILSEKQIEDLVSFLKKMK